MKNIDLFAKFGMIVHVTETPKTELRVGKVHTFKYHRMLNGVKVGEHRVHLIPGCNMAYVHKDITQGQEVVFTGMRGGPVSIPGTDSYKSGFVGVFAIETLRLTNSGELEQECIEWNKIGFETFTWDGKTYNKIQAVDGQGWRTRDISHVKGWVDGYPVYDRYLNIAKVIKAMAQEYVKADLFTKENTSLVGNAEVQGIWFSNFSMSLGQVKKECKELAAKAGEVKGVNEKAKVTGQEELEALKQAKPTEVETPKVKVTRRAKAK